MHRLLRVATTFLVSVMMASSLPGSLARKCRSILLKRESSTFLGSTSTNLIWLGCFLYSRLTRMALRPTDLPWPVAPAISRWGILARSVTKVSLLMVLPSTMGSSAPLFWNLSLATTARMPTTCGLLLGTSMPMVPLPGMGAMIRMPRAARLSAMSSSRFLILLMRTPAWGMISYRVTVGPMVALMRSMPML